MRRDLTTENQFLRLPRKEDFLVPTSFRKDQEIQRVRAGRREVEEEGVEGLFRRGKASITYPMSPLKIYHSK